MHCSLAASRSLLMLIARRPRRRRHAPSLEEGHLWCSFNARFVKENDGNRPEREIQHRCGFCPTRTMAYGFCACCFSSRQHPHVRDLRTAGRAPAATACSTILMVLPHAIPCTASARGMLGRKRCDMVCSGALHMRLRGRLCRGHGFRSWIHDLESCAHERACGG